MGNKRRATQAETNPYPYSDSNKRYCTFDYYMKKRFGKKCARIPLDAGFTCPNIDGSRGTGGCIFCHGGSSAAELGSGRGLEEQYEAKIRRIRQKWREFLPVPYLQAHTNTYGTRERIREVLNRAAGLRGAVMLAIGTRGDCLGEGVVEELREVSERLPVIVELGLQTSDNETARRINRGHTTEEFVEGYERLREAGGDIAVCVHLINGLPGEGREKMLESARFTAGLEPDMVKIHLMCALRGTELGAMYERGEYETMSMEEYVRVTADEIELMPPRTVIARVTGDAEEGDLAGPEWSRRKREVVNALDREFYRRGSYQGIKYVSTDKKMRKNVDKNERSLYN